MFSAEVRGGRISLGDDLNHRERVRVWCAATEGVRLEIKPVLPESGKLRRFFEGAIVPLVTFYQEGRSHRDGRDLEVVREWLKIEFNGDIIELDGRAHKVAMSTKGVALKGFVERVMEWLVENYQPPMEAIDPKKWKKWRNEVYPIPGSPDNYIDYLVELKLLNRY